MAAGDASAGTFLQLKDGRFIDDRWVGGRWDLSKFRDAKGEMDWDAVIDAEMARRKLLEESPIPSTNEEPVLFDTSEVPWWAWVRRFHLPEAEKLNGRAAMVGYFMALVVDQLTGYGLLDQQNSFLGKVLLHLTVFGVLLVRTTADLDKYKNLLDEATFYDKQSRRPGLACPGPAKPSSNLVLLTHAAARGGLSLRLLLPAANESCPGVLSAWGVSGS